MSFKLNFNCLDAVPLNHVEIPSKSQNSGHYLLLRVKVIEVILVGATKCATLIIANS